MPCWGSNDLWPIVFDDNVEKEDAHIIDMRDACGRPMAFDDVIGRNLIRAEPYLAIKDADNYFKDELLRCLERVEQHDGSAQEP